MEKTSRASNIELMRIVCILMIIAHHYAVHTGWEGFSENTPVLIKLLRAGAPVAINCFILITGYFCVNSKRSIKNKVLQLCRDRWFYSVLISAGLLVAGLASWSPSFLGRAVFPILTCRHNYVTTFIMLYLFIPYLNKFIHTLTEKEFVSFIVLLTFVISVIPTVLALTGLYTNNVYSYLLWMMYVYCLGAFVRRNEEAVRKYGLKLWSLLSLLLIAFIVLMELVVEPQSTILSQGYTSGTRHGIVPLLTSLVFFCFFLVLPMKTNKVINGLASSTFAVLLIHDDPMVRNVLWNNILMGYKFGNSEYLWIHALLSVVLVWIVCIVIDKIYVFGIQRFILFIYQKLKK